MKDDDDDVNVKEQVDTTTNVLYVLKRNAKALKMALEKARLLDKTYRMTPAQGEEVLLDNPSDYVAVPIVGSWTTTLKEGGGNEPWHEWVVTGGRQHCPYSSAHLGSQKQQPQRRR